MAIDKRSRIISDTIVLPSTLQAEKITMMQVPKNGKKAWARFDVVFKKYRRGNNVEHKKQ